MNINRIQDSVYLTNVSTDRRKSKLSSKTDSLVPVDASFMEIFGQEQEHRKKDETNEQGERERQRTRLEKEWELAQMRVASYKDEFRGNNIDWAG